MIIQLKHCRSKVLLIAAIGLAAAIVINTGLSHWLLYQLSSLQAMLNKAAVAKLSQLEANYNQQLLRPLLILAFVYGAIHAMGPGHGKTIIGNWVLAQQPKWQKLVLVTMGATLMHAFGAVAIIGAVVVAAGRYLPGSMNSAEVWLNLAAGVILIILGVRQLWQTSTTTKLQQESLQRDANPWLVMAAIGIVPCPLSAVMFMYCLAAKLPGTGLLLVTAFALGMGVALTVTASVVLVLKHKLNPMLASDSHNRSLLNAVSAVGFILLGLFILI